MTYNGYADADAFHRALRARWQAMTPGEVTQATSGHAGCDHASDYCAVDQGADQGARIVQTLRELHRVTAWRNGAVYRTEYVRDVWLTIADANKRPDNCVYRVKSNEFDGATFRTIHNGGNNNV